MNIDVSGALWNLWGVRNQAGSSMESLLPMYLVVLLTRSA